MTQSVTVIGLGAMGMGMARSLSGAGFSVAAFDLSTPTMAKAAEAGIATHETPAGAIAASDVILLSLPLASHVEATVDAGLAAGAFSEPKIVIDTSTSEAAVSRRLAAKLAELGHGFLDAPVSGGPQGAATGALSMMLGGDAQWVVRVQPVLDAIAARTIHVGPSGAGNIAKLVNNMLVACHMLTTSEGLRLAEASGLPAEDAMRVINNATGRSALSEVHFPNWVLSGSFDSGFSAGLMRKDVRLALELAQECDCAMPVSELVADLWSEENSGIADNQDFMLLGRLDGRAKEKTNG
ncbi:NAD(P)-dependent oxidoreductase [uncultured Nitratireductor sp.]|uniref:NAD(P)-dependent oxidoreductase n=1 Tax=uncultured Nitratireductor sp. TaxID=520953 RepID=UPI0025F775F7|nr:NAD(P)-dependent oxidoreductase [uncultured Nitratireductor sp.]